MVSSAGTSRNGIHRTVRLVRPVYLIGVAPYVHFYYLAVMVQHGKDTNVGSKYAGKQVDIQSLICAATLTINSPDCFLERLPGLGVSEIHWVVGEVPITKVISRLVRPCSKCSRSVSVILRIDNLLYAM